MPHPSSKAEAALPHPSSKAEAALPHPSEDPYEYAEAATEDLVDGI